MCWLRNAPVALALVLLGACSGSTSGPVPDPTADADPACGDGLIAAGEVCDDGNAADGDGCSAGCAVEEGWTCGEQPSLCTKPCDDASDCSDQNPCTDDTCAGDGLCAFAANTAGCNDGIYCNGADACSAGVCTHAGDPCAALGECANSCDEGADDCFADEGQACADDGNPCTDNTCSATGECLAANNSAACDDGVYCNGADTCSGGACGHAGDPCLGGSECADTCDEVTDDCFADEGQPCTADNNPCTDNVCDAAGACAPVSNANTCDDGLFCNGADVCASGSCGHSGSPCRRNMIGTSYTCYETADSCSWPSFTSMSVGTGHACGINVTGAVYCWGDNGSGQLGLGAGGAATAPTPTAIDLTPITGRSAFVSISCGDAHTCGITADGVTYCWGDDGKGQLGNGAALTGARLSPSPVDVSALSGVVPFMTVSAGAAHTCAISATGAAYCWGDDGAGQVGNGAATGDATSPSIVDTSTVSGDTAWAGISAGNVHTCAVTAAGVAYCWGSDSAGQLGNGATSSQRVSPSAVDVSSVTGVARFTMVTASLGSHSCGLKADGAVYCWGDDASGQVGNGAALSGSRTSPSPIDTTSLPAGTSFRTLTSSAGTTCAVAADGAGYCWGSDLTAQLGDGGSTNLDQLSPRAIDVATVGGEASFVALAGGAESTCGLTVEGVAYCWGGDSLGQLGNGASVTGARASPDPIDATNTALSRRFVELAAGRLHTCGISNDGIAYCWGSDSFGQIANGVASSPAAINVSAMTGSRRFTQLSGGGFHTCGITAQGAPYCWGRDHVGQLGNGAALTADQFRPSLVDTSALAEGGPFIVIAAGGNHSCGLAADGTAYCWGDDGVGQLGNGATLTTAQVTPTPVDTSTMGGETTFVTLAAGYAHTCGVTPSGAAYCWGDDTYGRLGNGATTGNQVSPSPVDTTTLSGSTAFVRLSLGASHSCGITGDGRAYCWGSDSWGLLGDGPTLTDDAVSPSALDSSSRFRSIAAGGGHSCAVAADNVTYCWGSDLYGQVGNGFSTTYPSSPLAIDIDDAHTTHRRFLEVTTGYWHSCAVTTVGYAYCWGQDHDAQVGNGPSQFLESYNLPLLIGTSL